MGTHLYYNIQSSLNTIKLLSGDAFIQVHVNKTDTGRV